MQENEKLEKQKDLLQAREDFTRFQEETAQKYRPFNLSLSLACSLFLLLLLCHNRNLSLLSLFSLDYFPCATNRERLPSFLLDLLIVATGLFQKPSSSIPL